MRIKVRVAVLACVLCVAPALAQQQQQQGNIQIIAQALDRCMATYAVRLTRTAASDDDIYGQATTSCKSLRDQLTAAIRAQVPSAQATSLLGSLDAQAKPNFMAMLAKIRSDRAARAGD
ncbi:MAG TPA: hypothetical protein VM662_08380 [Sphingomonas sp.]|nr:hypothetical protein [Sphingomonas sp.]